MTQITIQVEDQEKAHLLSELLRSLEFVASVNMTVENGDTVDDLADADFFSLFGIWKDRDIDLEQIRQQAWPKR